MNVSNSLGTSRSEPSWGAPAPQAPGSNQNDINNKDSDNDDHDHMNGNNHINNSAAFGGVHRALPSPVDALDMILNSHTIAIIVAIIIACLSL